MQQVLQSSLQGAHGIFLQVISDIAPATLQSVPAGANIQSLQAIIAHAVLDDDFIVNAMICGKGRAATAEALAGSGVPLPPDPRMTAEWAQSINMNLPAFIDFSKKVFASTEAAIGAMSDAELEAEMDGPFGKRPKVAYVNGFALYHFVSHTGEIAAMKGIHGMKGLPF